MRAHNDERSEQQYLQRHGDMVNTAWQHLAYHHNRFVDADVNDFEEKDRQSESALCWLREYRALIE